MPLTFYYVNPHSLMPSCFNLSNVIITTDLMIWIRLKTFALLYISTSVFIQNFQATNSTIASEACTPKTTNSFCFTKAIYLKGNI